MPEVSQLVSFGQTVIIIFLLLMFALRFSPRWERVRMRELEVSEREATAKQKQADSLVGLAKVIEKVADEQQKTAETNQELRIFIRAAMREHEGFNKRLSAVEELVLARKSVSGNENA
jgi:hypothetical protein